MCGRATLVLELVKGGEKTLRDGLGLEGVNTAKLSDSICAQLCDAGMQALETATRSAALFSHYIYIMLLNMFWTSCSRSHPLMKGSALKMPLELSEYFFLWRRLLL